MPQTAQLVNGRARILNKTVCYFSAIILGDLMYISVYMWFLNPIPPCLWGRLHYPFKNKVGWDSEWVSSFPKINLLVRSGLAISSMACFSGRHMLCCSLDYLLPWSELSWRPGESPSMGSQTREQLILPQEIGQCFTEGMIFDLSLEGWQVFCKAVRERKACQEQGTVCTLCG